MSCCYDITRTVHRRADTNPALKDVQALEVMTEQSAETRQIGGYKI